MIPTVVIDGVKCHWQVMVNCGKDKRFVCCRYVNWDVAMTEKEKKPYEICVDVPCPTFNIDDEPMIKALSDKYGIDSQNLYETIRWKLWNDKANELMKELEAKDGYKPE